LFLTIKQLSQGKIQLNRKAVNVHDAINDAIKVLQHEMNEKRVTLSCEFEAEYSIVNGESSRLQQIFWNLLKNAIKFSPPESGRILFKTFTGSSKIFIQCTDNGIGISPENQEAIFKPFEQGSSNITKYFGGLGLGLS
jgi:signal transduction histidine kinase